MSESVELKISLPKIPDIELVALEGLQRLASHLGISDDKIGEAKILATEAIINALEHAGVDELPVDIVFTMTKKRLIIFVQDYGKGFQPDSVEEPIIEKKLGTNKKRGWGLKLMRTMSDDITIESDEHGTKITLIKNLA
ncbi:ATP-binding protein [candidate division KSB1 bacterium]|nr:ATP-binding protein [candidate division KSB1 bacterium]